MNCIICNKKFYVKPSRLRRGNAKFCSMNCKGIKQMGTHPTKETLRKMSIAHIGVPKPDQRGCNNWNWKGGQQNELLKIRESLAYRQWRRAVFTRDDFTCIWCGVKGNGKNLNADHINPFSLYPELRLNLDNGRTLCVNCHRKTDTYGFKVNKWKEIHATI